ncbi:MAG: response regulator transcription factor [Pseudobutyrivibrio sp.]|nr:response regulator transcription factor [Pseudobutyrivibrio sp.]
MLRIAVCDDSSYMRELTKNQLVNYSVQNDIELKIDEYEAGELLIVDEQENGIEHNLIIIDYEFEEKGKNGIEIISALRTFNKTAKVIFLSSYPQVVFQSFEVEAFRFLVKPLDEQKLFKALDDYLNSIESNPVLSIRVDGEQFFYREDIITYIEGCGKRSILHFADNREPVMNNETLSAIEERVSDNAFFRCHKSFLVNMEHIESYTHTDVMLDSNEAILISRGKYKEFGIAYAGYISNKRGI